MLCKDQDDLFWPALEQLYLACVPLCSPLLKKAPCLTLAAQDRGRTPNAFLKYKVESLLTALKKSSNGNMKFQKTSDEVYLLEEQTVIAGYHCF